MESGNLKSGRRKSNPGRRRAVIKAFKRVLVFSLLFSAAAVYAQVVSSVSGREGILWVGGEYSRFDPDYGGVKLFGPAAIVDFNVTPKVGVLGEARWLHWGNNGTSETQSDYLAGLKYRAYRIGRLDLDVKLLAGGVWIKFPFNIGSGSYFAYAPGVFADYRLSRRFLIRGDYEYQFLPSAPNIPGQPDNGLTPNGFSIGVEYNVLRTR
jgi:hypothetical protein